MARLDANDVEDRADCLAGARRDLFVGLGSFGASVTEDVSRHWAEGQAPRLSRCVAIARSEICPDLGQCQDRRAFREAFASSDVLTAIRDRCRKSVQACAAMPPIGQAPHNLTARINIYLIADLGESFASAILLDTAAMLKSALMGYEHMLTAVLSFVRTDPHKAHIYATLREVEHCLRGGLSSEFGSSHVRGAAGVPPFDACLLLSDSNELGRLRDRSERVQVTARLLTESGLNDLLREGISAVRRGSASSPGYSVAGLSSARFPYDDLRLFCLLKWIEEVCKKLVAPPSHEGQNDLKRPAVRIPPLDKVYQSIDARLAESAQTELQLDSTEPDFLHWSRSQLGNRLKRQWGRFMERSHESRTDKHLQNHVHTEFVEPLSGSVVEAVDHLVRRPNGIFVAEETLAPLIRTLDECLAEARRKADAAGNTLQTCNTSIRDQLNAAISSDEPPLVALTRPQWYRPLCRWHTRCHIRQTEAKLASWYSQVAAGVRACSGKAHVASVWRCVQAAYEQMLDVVGRQQKAIERLRQALAQARDTCESRHREQMRPPTSVDRDIVTPSGYERFSAHVWETCDIRVDTSLLRELLSDHHLLDDFRHVKPTDLANRLAVLAESRFKNMAELTLREKLDAAGVAEQYADLYAWITQEVWDYATPLLTIKPSDARRPDNETAEIAMVRLPDLPDLQGVADNWPYSATPPMTGPATAHSVRLCRTVHGFRLQDIPWLRVCRADYVSHQHPEQLHIFDWHDKLPDILHEP